MGRIISLSELEIMMGVIFKVKSLTFIFAPIVNSIIGSAAEPRSSVVSIRTLILSKGNNEINKPESIAKINGFLEISINMFEMAFFEFFWLDLFRLVTIVVIMIMLIVGT